MRIEMKIKEKKNKKQQLFGKKNYTKNIYVN
jgi:hypothetical protein